MKTFKKSQRIVGLDTWRFVAAMWVVFGHCGIFPLTNGVDRTSSIGLAVQGIYGNLFPGVPAVIVFFVISGFCIHYPYRDTGAFELFPYLTRRYIRIGIPLIAAILLAHPFQVNLAFFQNSILWSLVAELIYYSLYPLLRILKARVGWNIIIVWSYLVSFSVILFFNPLAKDYSPSGNALNWLICFPCWLLGCRLAEEDFSSVKPIISRFSVWHWRLLVWFSAWSCSVLRFHSPIGYPWTLNIFAILIFFWLRAEITTFLCNRPIRVLEWAGKWSYSIYLIHLIAFAAYQNIAMPDLGVNLNWVQMMCFVLLFSYAFYLLIEKPGHLIAQKAGTFLKKMERSK